MPRESAVHRKSTAPIPEFAFPVELSTRAIDILALGSAVLEQVVRIQRWPARGGQDVVPVTAMAYTAGGCAVNVCCFAGRLGARTSIISSIGDGKYGEEVWAELARSNVDTAHARRGVGKEGSLIIIITNPEGDWAVLDYIDADLTLRMSDLPGKPIFEAAKILHIDGFSFTVAGDKAAVERAMQLGREAGCLISVDGAVPAAQSEPDYLAWLFAQADIVFANRFESLAATKTSSMKKAIAGIQTMGPKLAFVKMGLRGSYIITPWTVERVPAYEVEVVDTVAAGDAYISAVLVCLCQGAPLLQAATRGSAAGALACLGPGSLSSHFTMADIDGLIEHGSALRRSKGGS